MSVIVIWKKKQYEVFFKNEFEQFGDSWPKAVTLGALAARLAQSTNVSLSNMKLLQSGVHMKDFNAKLSDYRVRAGTRITMLGETSPQMEQVKPESKIPISKTHATPQSPTTPTTTTTTQSTEATSDDGESSLIDKLNAITTKTKETLLPIIELYSHQAQSFIAAHTAASEDRLHMTSSLPLPTIKHLKDSHARVSELLLQQLLQLDGVISEKDNVRASRREAVKYTNALLDRVDGLKDRVNSLIKDKGLL
ncbi:hypothetical protein SmJEL517_g01336 [Synchytrium microbalum]|uniref:BAG domain-containing protein n=1 Tax=Synchytrium microbalum TaxID=1806994 RepID=A0A507CEP1_9FUNG|nr:uncharacterized protein SmJEL517_g01336 [Synchytrium microbalum]TPX36496.1 hypothetical protein SmJEL517_g01336 [Synchytrium microbalum]